jgi:uncharacterized heparinase superfamily protein
MQFEKYYQTLRHLKLRQVAYRLYYLLRKRFRHKGLSDYSVRSSKAPATLRLIPAIPRYHSYARDSFTFLNIPYRFTEPFDWNYSGHGKLWCYNLTYFDFLNQGGMSQKEGLRLIHDFIGRIDSIRDGLEPYPTSLRIINWVKFLAGHQIRDEQIEQALYRQALHLINNLEYHLSGNHLLENGFALLFSAVLFPEGPFTRKAAQIICAELGEQILPDGGHFELSPMYHQTILDRLLDGINILQSSCVMPDLLPFLRDTASIMLGWLRQVTISNGEIPLVNDSAFGIAPTTAQLVAYAERLGVPTRVRPLGVSGYRKVAKPGYEMLVDVGKIGPDYIPGHAHSDTFNFVLYVHGRPLIVDTGTSTYETCERRLVERGTASHNTVQVDGLDQSEVWGSFRVARRAYVRELQEGNDIIRAWHDGYCRIGARHTREFEFAEDAIKIHDSITSSKKHDTRARIHFHPDVEVTLEGNCVVAGTVRILFTNGNSVILGDYSYAPEFNTLVPARMVEVSFSGFLTTHIAIG